MLAEKPDKFLVLGDTNSALAAFVAKRMDIPVYRMEAGNRSYDDRVPEDVNQHVIDHSSDVLMPYTERTPLEQIQKAYQLPIIVSTHPRTRSCFEAFGFSLENPLIRLMGPFGFFDFVAVISRSPSWSPPAEYLTENVSQTVTRILTGFRYA